MNTEEILNNILDNLEKLEFIKSDDIPNIDLYMDQVTTFMDKRLAETLRNKDEDKVLTKTMINNYAKNKLIPSPEKKKYSKEHVIILIFIYYYKNLLSINDIRSLLDPLVKRYFGKDKDFSVTDIYDEVTKSEYFDIAGMKEKIRESFEQSKTMFSDESEEDKEFLQTFSFICMLAFDVYVKKMIIERMLDDLNKN